VGSNPTPGAIMEPRLVSKKTYEAIINLALTLKKDGYRESTIIGYVRALKQLSKISNLFDPENVKEAIANKNVSLGRKEILVNAYALFCLNILQVPFERPIYNRIRKIPYIPTESEIDALITGIRSYRTRAVLQLIKETAIRPGEAIQLRWSDIDFQQKIVYVTPEKNSDPRALRISDKLIAMLNMLPRNGHAVFNCSLNQLCHRFFDSRKRLAKANPNLLKISFKTLRHWKATMEYHKTKDLLYVKQLLGHRSITSTLVYTHLINFENDEFVVRVARTLDEACKLVEAGFEYVTEMDGAKIFRKRK